MAPASNTVLALILVALGFIGIILSFLVVDKKKSMISLILAGVIVVAGAIEFGRRASAQYRWRQRIQNTQRSGQVDLEELRNRLRERAAQTRESAGEAQSPAQK